MFPPTIPLNLTRSTSRQILPLPTTLIPTNQATSLELPHARNHSRIHALNLRDKPLARTRDRPDPTVPVRLFPGPQYRDQVVDPRMHRGEVLGVEQDRGHKLQERPEIVLERRGRDPRRRRARHGSHLRLHLRIKQLLHDVREDPLVLRNAYAHVRAGGQEVEQAQRGGEPVLGRGLVVQDGVVAGLVGEERGEVLGGDLGDHLVLALVADALEEADLVAERDGEGGGEGGEFEGCIAD